MTSLSLPAAVVVGLDCVTGLQTARILAARGVPVIGIARDPNHFCCRTRSCRRVIHADTESLELVDTLRALGPELQQRAVLFPATDMSVLAISRSRDQLGEWYHVVLPEQSVVELLMDKGKFSEYADAQGLPIPRTLFLRSRSDAEAAAGRLEFPVIIKPSMKRHAWDENVSEKAYKVATDGELLAVYDRTHQWADVLIAQEWIVGKETNHFTCNCYFDSGSKPLVTFVTRKLRQWPPQTGSGSLSVEFRNDDVLDETVKLFELVGFHGLAYLEMKRDDRTGRHLIIEPNIGRPTGRSAVAEAAGVELLYTKYCDTVGLPLPSNLQQRYTGVKWIYFGRDIRSAARSWRRGELSVIEWWRSLRGRKVDAVFSLTDPVPFLLDTWRGVRLIARGAVRRVGGQWERGGAS